jgi:multisubunit Na+/H+ antiporter MnhE subunit
MVYSARIVPPLLAKEGKRYARRQAMPMPIRSHWCRIRRAILFQRLFFWSSLVSEVSLIVEILHGEEM